MDPEAQKMSEAYRLGEQASVASQLYGSVAPFAVAATASKMGMIPGASMAVQSGLKVAPRDDALEAARQNAMKAGQSSDSATRMLQQGYEPGWYHGTTGDIRSFQRNFLGEATGAESAKKAFFFARDPQNPPAHMLTKAPANSESVEMLKRLGIPEEQIAKLNTVSMEGHGAETASGYSALGGSREYKEAMRKANAAERSGKWDEYDKWMLAAENAETKRQKELQTLVSKYGEARDVMLDRINNALLGKKLPQGEAEALDAKIKQLLPYGWYNSYSIPQMKSLKGEIAKLIDEDAAKAVSKSIDNFISIKADRAIQEQYQQGSNVLPVALNYKNPMYYDFQGKSYRDQTYSDLLDQAIAGGHDALILKNTFDPGAGPAKLIDVAAVFNPSQVRSRFAAFDPARSKEADLLAGIGTVGAGLLSPAVLEYLRRRDEEGM
jgi:hypothetical protein